MFAESRSDGEQHRTARAHQIERCGLGRNGNAKIELLAH